MQMYDIIDPATGEIVGQIPASSLKKADERARVWFNLGVFEPETLRRDHPDDGLAQLRQGPTELDVRHPDEMVDR